METSKISKPTCLQSSASTSSSSIPKTNKEEEANTHQLNTAAYENYLRLPELRKLWSSKDFPEWPNDSLIRPSLQALEITFRFISIALSDSRPYINHMEWKHKLESLASHQIELISAFCEYEGSLELVPVIDTNLLTDIPTRNKGSQVWKIAGTSSSFVSHTSEASLLPSLASWEKSEQIASKIGYLIEGHFLSCQFTLGLGEPNFARKPSLNYDQIVHPTNLRALKRQNISENHEEQNLFTTLQILESWLHVTEELLSRIEQKIDEQQWVEATSNCWLLERIWKLLLDIEDMQLLMDPDDLLSIKAEMGINGGGGSFCFRSRAMIEVTKRSKELRIKVPFIVGVEADPSGGPRVQQAVMQMYHRHSEDVKGRVGMLQALQAVEAATKRFFFGHRQIISSAMGSLEAGGNSLVYQKIEELDSLSQAFLEPPYFPSLDATKTFLGHY